jgi:hypothetical protein
MLTFSARGMSQLRIPYLSAGGIENRSTNSLKTTTWPIHEAFTTRLVSIARPFNHPNLRPTLYAPITSDAYVGLEVTRFRSRSKNHRCAPLGGRGRSQWGSGPHGHVRGTSVSVSRETPSVPKASATGPIVRRRPFASPHADAAFHVKPRPPRATRRRRTGPVGVRVYPAAQNLNTFHVQPRSSPNTDRHSDVSTVGHWFHVKRRHFELHR